MLNTVSGSLNIKVAIRVGRKPLSKSPISVMLAAFLPAMRSTLVAPGLSEPSLRGSENPIILLRIMALEIAPNRYEKIIKAKNVGVSIMVVTKIKRANVAVLQ